MGTIPSHGPREAGSDAKPRVRLDGRNRGCCIEKSQSRARILEKCITGLKIPFMWHVVEYPRDDLLVPLTFSLSALMGWIRPKIALGSMKRFKEGVKMVIAKNTLEAAIATCTWERIRLVSVLDHLFSYIQKQLISLRQWLPLFALMGEEKGRVWSTLTKHNQRGPRYDRGFIFPKKHTRHGNMQLYCRY